MKIHQIHKCHENSRTSLTHPLNFVKMPLKCINLHEVGTSCPCRLSCQLWYDKMAASFIRSISLVWDGSALIRTSAISHARQTPSYEEFPVFKSRVRDLAKSSESHLRALTPKASALKGDSLDLAKSRTRDDEVVRPRSGPIRNRSLGSFLRSKCNWSYWPYIESIRLKLACNELYYCDRRSQINFNCRP